MAAPGAVDPWIIQPRERARYEEQFRSLQPINGIVTGDQAKGFLLQSQLPPAVLGQIWGLADTDADGKMNITEFSIACKLINLKLRGFEIPKVLPPSLLQQAPLPGVAPLINTNLLQNAAPPIAAAVPTPLVGLGAVRPMTPPLMAAAQQPPLRSAIPPMGMVPSMPAVSLGMRPPTGMMAPSVPIAPVVSAPTIPLASVSSTMPIVPPTVPVAPVVSSTMPLVPGAVPIAPVVPMAVTSQAGVAAVTAPPRPPPVGSTPPAVPAMERVASLDSPLSLGSPLHEWAVPYQSKLKYTQLFNTTDRARSGFLSGPQARNIMVQTQLAQPILAQIWALSDMDTDGRLSCEEFVLAMHLCDMAKNGEKIPAPLPPDLIPPTFRRQRQGSIPGVQAEPMDKDVASSLPTVTFEDKRKENFDKGQAELERRRKALLEIQRKEQEERDRKEKEEQEKKEKIRQEQERRRQLEFEKQLQRQREQEQEREEQRRRAQEQREAARREMERQRQLEWEKQRCQELQQQRQREQEKVLQLKAKNQNLSIELSQLNEKVKELSQKISETRVGVSGVKTTIDGMRTTRDTQLQEMSALKTKLKEQNQRLVALSQEKVRLEARNKMNMAADSANQEQVKLAFSNKQITLKQMRDRLQDLQKEIDGKLQDIENNNSQLGDLKQQLAELVQECEQLYASYEERRNKVLEMKGISGRIRDPTDFSSSWGTTTWDTAPEAAWDNAAPAAWPETVTPALDTTTAANSNYVKYRALYEFVARNSDELSFQPGDIIMVPLTQNAEPGWLAGELRGLTGWFPESYVEQIEDPSIMPLNGEIADPSAAFPADIILGDAIQNKRQLEEIAEVPENVSDNGSVAEAVDMKPQVVNELASPVLGEGLPVDNIPAQAMFSWQARKNNQLSFNKGDLITVKEQQEEWWYGECVGTEGWFPKSYVKLVEKLPEEYYMAMYPYQSVEVGDLSFLQGEVILVTKKEGDWWTGVIGDRTGIFPSNYVQLVSDPGVVVEPKTNIEPILEEPAILPADEPVAPVTPVTPVAAPVVEEVTPTTPIAKKEEPPPEKTAGTPDSGPVSGTTSQLEEDLDAKRNTPEFFHSPKGRSKKPEIATVIAPYQATSAEQLNLQRGQLIMIRKKTSTGWWEGELQAKGKKRQVGWFPASYVKLLGGGNRSSTPVAQKQDQSPAATGVAPPAEKVIALYPYKALNDDELSFEKDDVITLIAKEEAQWWRGELRGMSGLFPSNYVAPVLDTTEQMRQGYIQELISTEQAYIEDMSIVHDVFEKPLLEGDVLTKEEVHKIFVNWREIIECNHMFLRALRVRRDMSAEGEIRMIGDILCENLPRMTAYVRFCSCQLSAATFLQQLTETSSDFRDLVRRCQCDPRTKGMPLSSFLIKPMQRITKYPLIIKKILEFTPEGHPDRQNLQEALYKAEEFCKQVNEGVRAKENSDRLEWLQRRVQCDGLPEELIFNSMTNSLGPRKFLHYGFLHKAKSGKELMGFLLNDFLLLAQPSKSLAGNHTFSFERCSNINFKLYKKPLFLNEITLVPEPERAASPPDSNDALCTLRLQETSTPVCHVLVAPSASERNLWAKRIEEARRHFLEMEKSNLQRQQSKQAQFVACGRVLVFVMEGVGLKPSAANGKCDAFCEVSMGSQEHRTPVINTTSNPRWNASMQFLVKDLQEDVLCITVFNHGHFCPNEFLGRTEVRVADIFRQTKDSPGPINSRLKLREVDSGEVTLKLDLRLFSRT